MSMHLPLLLKLQGKLHGALVWMCEKVVDLLQTQLGGFGVAEVNKRHKCEIGAHKDEVCLPLETVDNYGGDHDNEEVLTLISISPLFQQTKWNPGGLTQIQFEEIPTAVPLALACKGKISGT